MIIISYVGYRLDSNTHDIFDSIVVAEQFVYEKIFIIVFIFIFAILYNEWSLKFFLFFYFFYPYYVLLFYENIFYFVNLPKLINITL